MHEIDRRSIRILVDLQATQTSGSARRGVGRYSRALFDSLFAAAAPRQVFGLTAAHYPGPVFDHAQASRLVQVAAVPNWETERDFYGGEQDSIDGLIYSAAANVIAPDVVHVSHIFEGFGERVAIPSATGRPAGQVLSATLYDLIPLRFPEHYFQSSAFKNWYFLRLKFYLQADLLLSISEASRQDAIDLLGIDPARIVTIHGGISDRLKPISDQVEARHRLRTRYGITKGGFVLYTGGDDHRKNLGGAIEAYAALPRELRDDNQLVIVCSIEEHRKEIFSAIASKAGLAPEDLRLLGFVPEDDLVALYSTCSLFFFPSLYEGLGLPLLEAMACGAPVIGGDNSSIREIIGRRDALFDAAVPASIAERITAVLNDNGFANDLRRHSRERAARFTWANSAGRALEAFDEVLARKREVGVHAAVNGLLPRRRLAMLTPLPPCRSGVADYNAHFVWFLAKHFDIDLYVDGYTVSDKPLTAAFRVFDVSELRHSARAYDVILYELGNSEFHAYMLPLLKEFPGVVGLHDAFLSGLMSYLEFNLGDRARYGREALGAHGGQARRLLAPTQERPDGIGASMVELPCTKDVLDHAIGLISHSRFNLKVARERHPEGWLAPYRIIPQMIAVPEHWPERQAVQARSQVGFGPDDFIIATFGHVAWTKLGDRLLNAFVNSDLGRDVRCHLVFAGELAEDDFGLNLKDGIRKSGLRKRIRVTGFLADIDYERYLRIADVAVQLRTKSRGGTPRGVLDCLAHRLPVLVNQEASYEDYPDDVVVKLSSDPSSDEIAASLATLRVDQGMRQRLAERGLRYVSENHNPEVCAAEYAAAIHEFVARHAARESRNYAAHLAPHLAACSDRLTAAKQAAQWLDARSIPNFARPRLVIDVSHIAHSDHETGIQRVVKETVRWVYCSGRPGFEALAVERAGDQLIPATAWLDRQRLLLPHEVTDIDPRPVSFKPGDCLLMLDSSWAAYDQFEPVFNAARAERVPIITAVYDLLPISAAPGNFVDGGKEWFEAWLHSAIAASDGLLCISRSVADELIAYIKVHGLGHSGLKVGWRHLGSTFPVSPDVPPDSPVRKADPRPYCLMIGTLEPRKNHELALDAFERLWAKGSNLNLVIAGKPGWLVDRLLNRLRAHPQLGKKLFLFERVSDAEVSYLYRAASGLLLLSKGEGFGLPLVEAAHYGVPIVCSRIPVFREIAGEHATYVDLDDDGRLALEIDAWWCRARVGEVLRSDGMPRLTWEQSAEALLDIVLEQNWYWTQ